MHAPPPSGFTSPRLAHHIRIPPCPPSHQDSLRRCPPLLPFCPLPSSPKRELMARLDSLLLMLLCMQVFETRTTTIRTTTRMTTRTTARTTRTTRTTMTTADDDDGDLRPDGDRRLLLQLLLRCRGPSRRRDGGAATTEKKADDENGGMLQDAYLS